MLLAAMKASFSQNNQKKLHFSMARSGESLRVRGQHLGRIKRALFLQRRDRTIRTIFFCASSRAIGGQLHRRSPGCVDNLKVNAFDGTAPGQRGRQHPGKPDRDAGTINYVLDLLRLQVNGACW